MLKRNIWPKLSLSHLILALYRKLPIRKMDHVNNKMYSFDINKVDQIFDILLKDKQITLLDGYKILPKEKQKIESIVNIIICLAIALTTMYVLGKRLKKL